MTTRNRLHSARLCIPMLQARAMIARQLASTPGLLRYASGVAGPSEFLTLTIWEDKAAMQAFMRSGAHERFMWLFSRWTKSFWGMRWEPSDEERGEWDGLRLARSVGSARPISPLVAAGLLPSASPRAGPTGPRREAGGVEPRGSRLFGVTARLEGTRGLAAPLQARRRLRAEAEGNADLVRWTVGLDLPPCALVVTLWRDSSTARSRALELLGRELGSSSAMRWQPGDYEIDHWDGLRLRQTARRASANA